jgi:mannose-6-phosphate isomerase-like protein (cupin superfamily)
MQTLTEAEGRRADFPVLGNRYLITTEETGGRFALLEHTVAPRSLAAPTHVHVHEDEYSFVLEGTVGVQIGDEVVEAGPGTLVFKPRGIPHAFWNPGDEEARLLELISPGGFSNYFTELAPLLSSGGPPDLEALAEVQARYDLSMDRDSIGPLAEAHGLNLPGE